jgi:hypothetical protein
VLSDDLTSKRDSYPLHIANDLADSDGFGSGTTVVFDRLVADHQDDGVVDDARRRLALGHPGSASPGHEAVIHQASKLRVNAEITQGSANHVGVDVIKEVRDEGANVVAKGGEDSETANDDDHARSTRMSSSTSASCSNPASNSNGSVSEQAS